MYLAGILSKYEDLVICDLAEYYGILEYEKLPPLRIASFVLGLRENSRVMLKLQNQKITTENYLLAGILDRLSLLVWANTKDAQKGKNKPKMILDLINKKNVEYNTFYSGEEFKKEREKIIQKVGGGKCQT